jgi:hypothetical protein
MDAFLNRERLDCQRRDDPRGPQLVERFYQPVFRPEDFVAAVLTQSSKTGAGQALMKSHLHQRRSGFSSAVYLE